MNENFADDPAAYDASLLAAVRSKLKIFDAIDRTYTGALASKRNQNRFREFAIDFDEFFFEFENRKGFDESTAQSYNLVAVGPNEFDDYYRNPAKNSFGRKFFCFLIKKLENFSIFYHKSFGSRLFWLPEPSNCQNKIFSSQNEGELFCPPSGGRDYSRDYGTCLHLFRIRFFASIFGTEIGKCGSWSCRNLPNAVWWKKRNRAKRCGLAIFRTVSATVSVASARGRAQFDRIFGICKL